MAEKNILEIVRTSQPLPLPKQRVDEVPQFPSFINVWMALRIEILVKICKNVVLFDCKLLVYT